MNCQAKSFLILLIITNLALIVSLGSPYWLGPKGMGFGGLQRGLWMDCENLNCTWYVNLQDGVVRRDNTPVWYAWTATQVLMTVGLLMSFVALLVTIATYCADVECPCFDCAFRNCLCKWLMTRVLDFCWVMVGGALTVFGIMAKTVYSEETLNLSFWTAVGGAGGAAVASIFHQCTHGIPSAKENED